MSDRQNAKLEDLVGKDLSKFKVVEMTEVFSSGDRGRGETLGYFKDPIVAKAFAGIQTSEWGSRTCQQFVLTDGTQVFLFASSTPVKVFNDEEEALRIKQKIVNNLSPAERAILGF